MISEGLVRIYPVSKNGQIRTKTDKGKNMTDVLKRLKNALEWNKDNDQPITEEVGFVEVESDLGPEYIGHFKNGKLNVWEFNGTGVWLFSACDAIEVESRGELRALAALLKITL
jgi:hypothetical protein